MNLTFAALEGALIRLEPFCDEVKQEVQAALNCDAETWLILPMNAMGEHFEAYWTNALEAVRLGLRLPYAIRVDPTEEWSARPAFTRATPNTAGSRSDRPFCIRMCAAAL